MLRGIGCCRDIVVFKVMMIIEGILVKAHSLLDNRGTVNLNFVWEQ